MLQIRLSHKKFGGDGGMVIKFVLATAQGVYK